MKYDVTIHYKSGETETFDCEEIRLNPGTGGMDFFAHEGAVPHGPTQRGEEEVEQIVIKCR